MVDKQYILRWVPGGARPLCRMRGEWAEGGWQGMRRPLKVADRQFTQLQRLPHSLLLARCPIAPPAWRRHKVVDYIRRERAILDRLRDCEGVARLHFTFQAGAACCSGPDRRFVRLAGWSELAVLALHQGTPGSGEALGGVWASAAGVAAGAWAAPRARAAGRVCSPAHGPRHAPPRAPAAGAPRARRAPATPRPCHLSPPSRRTPSRSTLASTTAPTVRSPAPGLATKHRISLRSLPPAVCAQCSTAPHRPAPPTPAGELYDQIRLRGRLEPGAARAYAAEVVLLLEQLRAHGVVHRCAAKGGLRGRGHAHAPLAGPRLLPCCAAAGIRAEPATLLPAARDHAAARSPRACVAAGQHVPTHLLGCAAPAPLAPRAAT